MMSIYLLGYFEAFEKNWLLDFLNIFLTSLYTKNRSSYEWVFQLLVQYFIDPKLAYQNPV
jgi:hypothetical protein